MKKKLKVTSIQGKGENFILITLVNPIKSILFYHCPSCDDVLAISERITIAQKDITYYAVEKYIKGKVDLEFYDYS